FTFFAVKILFAQNLEADYIFKNVNIITMKDDKVLPNKTIVIKGGKILEISDKTKYKSNNTINAKGKYLMPTMADAHVHLPQNNEELEKVMKLNLINGVTKLRSMRGDWNDVNRRIKYTYEKDYYPRLYLSPAPIHRSHELSVADLETYVKASKDNGFDFIKILSIKNQSMLKQLDSICKKYDVKIAGHYPEDANGVSFPDDMVFSTNYKTFEHLGGLIGESEHFENRVKKMKQNNIFVCPTMQWFAIGYGQYGVDEMLNQKGMEYIPTEIKKDWAEKSKNYREKLGKEAFEQEKNKYAIEMQERLNATKRLNDEGVKLLLSPDSSSKFIVPGFGMLEEMKLYKKANISNFDILKSATTNFAMLFNENYGTIETGKNADFILLSQNPLQDIKALENIDAVFYNKFYLDKKQLNEIAKSILPK
ncbi:MAG: amidohydrolase family protein, partial [Bacteroidetes bacterium]|nr:amidohydrolase family protein [Bacteroidota bacterium]